MAAALVGLIASAGALSLEDDFETALGTVGLNQAAARFDANLVRFFGEGEFPTPAYLSLYSNPWRAPFYVDMWRRQLAGGAGKPADVLSAAARFTGVGTRRSLIGDPINAATTIAAQPGALQKVLEEMRAQKLLSSAIPSLADVPADTQAAAALILRVALDTVPLRRLALTGVKDLKASFAQRLAGPDAELPENAASLIQLIQAADMRYMLAAANDVLAAAAQARSMLGVVDPAKKYQWSIETLWGRVSLSGGADIAYDDKPTLLSIDTGGNDTYLNASSTASFMNWLSVSIDTAGDDRYLSDAALGGTEIAKWEGRKKQAGPWGPASALFGVAVLVDAAGNDTYRSHRPGLAYSEFGAAYLWDVSGDDVYDAYANSEGAAANGVAVLEDGAGKDRYSAFTQSQGYGGVMGSGLLLDRGGEDTYILNDAAIDFPSPQSKEHNVSMGQGAGNGRRADYIDGRSLSGGVGMLYDLAGNDTYSAGVFAQGVGYWQGVGILSDGAGNDKYSGQWYVQGASAHFAVGYLEDEAGDDSYEAPMNMALGAGHDFGYGMLIERGGADRYKAPSLSLGAGNANGLGIFVDQMGDDKYDSLGVTLGKAAESPKGTMRERALALGVFIDGAGNDTYPASISWAVNGARTANWTDKGPTPAESQCGVFWDR